MSISFNMLLLLWLLQTFVGAAILVYLLVHHNRIADALLEKVVRQAGAGALIGSDAPVRPKVPVPKEIGREVFPVR